MKKTFVIFFLLCLLISACAVESNTGLTTTALASATTTRRPTFTPRPTKTPWPTRTLSPTRTPTLTFTPTFTSTPQPPLIPHSWQPEGVLVVLDGIGGDGGYRNVSYPPGFVLFFDGRLYFTSRYKENNDWKWKFQYTQLGRKGTCQLLNTIDQNGFLDYDPLTYETPQSDGGPSTIITVNAWKRVSGTFYDLDHLVNGLYVNSHAAPVLSNTFNLLSWYEPTSAQKYEPDRIAVWIYENIWSKEDNKDLEQEWTLSTPRLAEIHSLTGSAIEKSNGQYIIYRSDIARNIFNDLENWNYRGIFVENGRQYTVFAQVLLPYQLTNNLPEERGFLSMFSGFPDRRPTLNCYQSDGLLPIPTPPSE